MFARTIVDVRATATGGPRHGRIYLTPGRSYRRRMTKILHLGQTLSFTGDPFVEGSAAATHSSRGAVLVEDGRVIATGEAGLPIRVSLRTDQCTPERVAKLKEVLTHHPGTSEVHLTLVYGTKMTALRLDDSLKVMHTSALMGDLKALLGPGCLGG